MTDIPDDVIKTARWLYRDVRLSDTAAKPIMINDIARAIMDARNAALDEAANIIEQTDYPAKYLLVAAISALKHTLT